MLRASTDKFLKRYFVRLPSDYEQWQADPDDLRLVASLAEPQAFRKALDELDAQGRLTQDAYGISWEPVLTPAFPSPPWYMRFELLATVATLPDYAEQPELLKVIEFVKRKHAGQTRMNGQPYWTHPLAVARQLWVAAHCRDAVVLKTALCHDLLEDTDTTYDALVRVIGEVAANGVMWLTKPKDKPNDATVREAWTLRYYDSLRQAPLFAIRVKAYDRIHNLYELADAPFNFRRRYLLDSSGLIACLEHDNGMMELGWLKRAYWQAARAYSADMVASFARAADGPYVEQP